MATATPSRRTRSTIAPTSGPCRQEGVDSIVSVASVGGIRNDLWPGELVLPHQIIDYTWGRASTYFEGPGQPVNHIDFTEPYSRAAASAFSGRGRDAASA